MQTTEIQVQRTALERTRTVVRERTCGDGDVLVEVERFALTANNVTYAVAGDSIGYWHFHPACEADGTPASDAGWGIVPVWGFATVVASHAPGIAVGERLWGFLPMASHAVLRPADVRSGGFRDASAHRAALPAVYNQYARTAADAPALAGLDDARCLLFPLLTTSYVLHDWLKAADGFGAGPVLIGSVSSKTGLGLAALLDEDPDVTQRIVGLTSDRNRAFVDALEVCDEVVAYGEEAASIDADVPAVFVDMSGDAALARRLGEHLRERLVVHCAVGATHWDARGEPADGPSDGRAAKPEFFFAPAHIAKRDAELGRGELIRRANEANARIARRLLGVMSVDRFTGSEAVAQVWCDLVANRVAPDRGVMAGWASAAASRTEDASADGRDGGAG